jgi:hypothetical protein
MSTAKDLVEESKSFLYGTSKENFNFISGALDNSSPTVTLKDEKTMPKKGTILSADLELMLCRDDGNATTKQVTVVRGWLGSTKATHNDDAIVYYDAKFPDVTLFKMLNHELEDLSSPDNGLFRIKRKDFTYDGSVKGYDLNVTDLIDIWEIRYKTAGNIDKRWPIITSWDLSREFDSADFVGPALFLHEKAHHNEKVSVRYKAKFGLLSAANYPNEDVETATGLHSEAHRILTYGVAGTLMPPREAKRAFMERQGVPRRAEEVSEGAQIRSGGAFLARRAQWIRAEKLRLARMYPRRGRR